MKPTLLDTDILLDILQGGQPTVQQNAQQYLAAYGRYTITAVTVAELARGAVRGGESAAWLDVLLGQVEVLPLEAASARLAGQIYGELERQGQAIGLADCLIAGIALAHGRVVVTGNVRHFVRIAELGYPLEIANWRAMGIE